MKINAIFLLQVKGNDKLDFLCNEDFSSSVRPDTWLQALEELWKEYATDVVIQATAEVLHNYELIILTARKVRVIIENNVP